LRPLEINLATRPFRNNTLYWTGFGSAALGLAALTVVNLWLFIGFGSSMEFHRQDLSAKQRRRDALLVEEQRLGRKLEKTDFKGLAVQADFANDAIRRRTFSWTELFNRLEEVVPPTVMMLSIRPDIQPEGISIIVEGIANDPEGLLQFEENLLRKPVFARIYPGSERREQRDRQLHFSLQFDYLASRSREAPAASAAQREKPEGPPPEGAGPSLTPPAAPSIPPAGIAASPPVTSPPAQHPPPVAHAGEVRAAPASAPQAPRSGMAIPHMPLTSPLISRAPRGEPRPFIPSLRGRIPPGTRTIGADARGGPGGRRRLRGENPSARFEDRPIQEILDFLTREWKLTLLFGGDLDLQRKVTLDLAGREEEGVLVALCEILECVFVKEADGVYRLSPRSGGEPLEEPPVEEAPVKDEKAGSEKESP